MSYFGVSRALTPLRAVCVVPALSTAWFATPLPAAAQSAADSTVIITGNPLGSERLLQPSATLSGNGLSLRRSATLGETLDGLPGVSATGFGPNASRPVIRGLDGDRVRLLDNGGASVDASSLSFDHAVAIDPLVIERVEVLRGPAVLLYGGSATGGVVNSIDNRIPRLAMTGLSGRAEVRLGGASDERAGSAVIEGGTGGGTGGGFAWHADAFGRRSDNQRTPSFTPVEDGVPLAVTDRVRNSAARAEGGAIGAGFVGAWGRVGMSSDTYRNNYGVTAEPDVTLRMKRERQALSGAWNVGGFGLEQITFEGAHTRYRHEEVEGSGAVGTTFSSRGDDGRLELRHAPVAGLRGVLGAQWERLDFSALGVEAFVPGTRTNSGAVFVLEEWQAQGQGQGQGAGGATLSAGARAERTRVASDGDAADATDLRFGPTAERRFAPKSFSLGARVPLVQGLALSASLARSERAPTYYELYANGVHVATGAYERGDTALSVERSRHAELGLAWTRDASKADKVQMQVFQTRFTNYIALDATGATVSIPAEDPADPPQLRPEYAFRAVRARLSGFEVEARTRLLSGAPLTMDLDLTLDQVRGDNLDTGEPLPRLAPLRARAALDLASGPWRGGLVLRHAARQDRVPATDTATPSYTMLDLWFGLALPLPGEASAFVRLTNVTDALGYNSAALGTVRGLSPLAGRALAAGLRWRW